MKYPTPLDAPAIVYAANDITNADDEGLEVSRDFLIESNGLLLADALMSIWQLVESGRPITRDSITAALNTENKEN